MFENLEFRRLLAVQVSASAGLLTISGDKDANVINVIERAGAVHVETSTLPGGAITEQDFTGITAINIKGGGDDDTIFYDGDTVGANILGDEENGSGGGGNGNDQITVTDNATGSSTVNGGVGNDDITIIRGNSTHVFGGNGNDQIFINTGGDATGSVIADGENGGDTFTVYAGTNTINGGNGNDTVIELGGTNMISSATVV